MLIEDLGTCLTAFLSTPVLPSSWVVSYPLQDPLSTLASWLPSPPQWPPVVYFWHPFHSYTLGLTISWMVSAPKLLISDRNSCPSLPCHLGSHCSNSPGCWSLSFMLPDPSNTRLPTTSLASQQCLTQLIIFCLLKYSLSWHLISFCLSGPPLFGHSVLHSTSSLTDFLMTWPCSLFLSHSHLMSTVSVSFVPKIVYPTPQRKKYLLQ